MGCFSISHPDIEEFIHAKNNSTKLTGFNISILVTDEFMKCLKAKKPFPLTYEGKVYKAIEHLTGREWAVKIIKLNRRGTREQTNSIEDLLREADMMRDMSHDNIIRLQDVFQTAEQLFFVMEFVSDGDLLDHLQKHGKFSEATARDFMRQLLSAVNYLHERHIVHRDLKPENILLEIRGDRMQVKITDFGLSRDKAEYDVGQVHGSLMAHTALMTVCGSTLWMAPEVLLGHSSPYGPYNEKADVYSYAMCLVEMVSLQLPWHGCGGSAEVPLKVSRGERPETQLERVAHLADLQVTSHQIPRAALRCLPSASLP